MLMADEDQKPSKEAGKFLLGSTLSELQASSSAGAAKQLLETVGALKRYDFLDQITKSSLASQMAGIDALRLKIPVVPAHVLKPREFEIPPPILPPRPEETKIGKATLATAEQLQEVVRLNSEMVSHVSGLTEIFVKDVFPQWQQKLADDQAAAAEILKRSQEEATNRQKEAQASLDKANKSLLVAIYALIASVVVTIGCTGWQLWVAKQYRAEDTQAQASGGTVAEEQLKELKALREELVAKKKAPPASEGASQLRRVEVPQPPPAPLQGSASQK